MKNLDALINAIRYICVKADVAETTIGEICHQVRHSGVDTERNRLQSLIDEASGELPDHRRSGEAIGYEEYDTLREAATLAIAKERALREAAEETMVYQHRGLEEETTLRELLEEEIKQYKHDNGIFGAGACLLKRAVTT